MKRTQIAPGVHLSYDAAQKFNRCRISIHFSFPARRETATAHALLPLVMERGYADCPDMTQLTKKLARLYGADLTVDARPMGCSHNLCVSITGIKDQFALEGEKLTQEYAALALGTAFHPYFVGGTFDPEAVGIEKQMLKKALEDEVNDKRLYCQRQANREFFGDSPAGVRQEGYLEEVDGLTPEMLTEAYDEMLRPSTASRCPGRRTSPCPGGSRCAGWSTSTPRRPSSVCSSRWASPCSPASWLQSGWRWLSTAAASPAASS